jgi:hypothetical protein
MKLADIGHRFSQAIFRLQIIGRDFLERLRTALYTRNK